MTSGSSVQYRYAIYCDMKEYMAKSGAGPRGPISFKQGNDAIDLATVKEYFETAWHAIARVPVGSLKNPFVVPGAWYPGFWDWDSFYMTQGLPDEGAEYAKFCISNLLDGVRIEKDGRPPKGASPDGKYSYYSHPVPLQAQYAYLGSLRVNDFSWVEKYWDTLNTVLAWYDENCMNRGFYVWQSFRGNGLDNNPAVYGRPPKSSAGVDLASWHYRELLAMYKIGKALNKNGIEVFSEKAESLKQKIQTEYWDHVDEFFYNIDLTYDEAQSARQKVRWHLYLKFRSFACLYPLWAGVATQEQAKAVVTKVMDTQEFLSIAGVRTHSAKDPIYNNNPMGGAIKLARTSMGSFFICDCLWFSKVRIQRGSFRNCMANDSDFCCRYQSKQLLARIL